MIYDGRKAAGEIQNELRARVAKLPHTPSLLVISVSSHPSIASFIKIKRKFGEALGVEVNEFNFEETITEVTLLQEITTILGTKSYTGAIIQLPLPPSLNTQTILDAIPVALDVDVLGTDGWNRFVNDGKIVPPVAGAVAHILKDTVSELRGKNVVVIGQGKLVGLPVSTWLAHQGVTPHIIDIDTDEPTRMKLYNEADIVITGIGSPHHLIPEYFKNNVVLIDAGTSEQSGVLSGDCDPRCASTALVFTPVPGGVGPLTVAHLFKNLIEKAD
jgi:methylenetetrahydrofolate dehydrogenase (NADP+)/methenyltetrahydrofolate cyclohydrolase